MKKLIVLVSVSIFFCFANAQSGIQFVNDVTNWNEMIQKAKAEHKYIFVDCYATWCLPCKAMDQNIYPLQEVGDIFNKGYVSIKVQMDRTADDREDVKKLYNVARMLEQTYSVNSYPTFLFFDADGKPVHKVSGSFNNASEFIGIAGNAQNPEKQYYNIIKSFQPGKIDTAELKEFIKAFKYSDKILAGKMAADYLNRIPKNELALIDNGRMMIDFQDNPAMLEIAIDYIKSHDIAKEANFIEFLIKKEKVRQMALDYIKALSKKDFEKKENLKLVNLFASDSTVQQIVSRYINGLQEKKFYKKDMIGLLMNFTKTTKDRGFDIFYHHADKIDAVMNRKGLGRSVAQQIIEETETRPILKLYKEKMEQPDFEKMYSAIESKYDPDMAQGILISSKLDWYKFLVYTKKQDKYWPELINNRIAKVERNRSDTVEANVTSINNIVYNEMFLHCDDTKQLNIVARWMKNIVDRNPTNATIIDTYGCILYKAGRITEALAWEEKATTLDQKDKEIQDNFEKMKKGEKFWLPKG